ncbi:MAG TPA: hypothetical protein VFT46_03980 [Holophagaceae bacterium]|nr:hypothetical protein [Holophagaceae bacterium]
MRARTLLLAALALALLAPASLAADQPKARFASFDDWIGSVSKGVSVGADGALRLAPAERRVGQLPEGVIWCAAPDGQGGAYLSAGTEGKLYHYANGQMRPLAQVKGGIVFAMAKVGQDLIVAPSGDGKLYRVSSAGTVKPWCDLEAGTVWAMRAEGTEVVCAAGGPSGAVLISAREGASRKLTGLPEETAFTALCPDGSGGYYAGTLGRGLVVHYNRVTDRLEILMDTPFEEVRALAFEGGDLYIGADNGLASSLQSGKLEKREGFLTSDPQASPRCAVIRLAKDGVPQTLWQSARSQVYALQAWKGRMLVGTGNRSLIFALPLDAKDRDANPFELLTELGAGQATAFLPAGAELLVAASNPAEIHALSELQATEGSLESPVIRAQPLADWGRAVLDAETPEGTSATLQFRTGFTEEPDATWTPWTPPLRSGELPSLAPSRFAQFRVRLSATRGGATPVARAVTVRYANRNLPPQWEGVDILPPGLVITRSAPPDDIGIERVPLETQKLIPALGYAGSERRSFRRGSQSFTFRISDPNGDQLEFRIRLLPDRGAPIPLEDHWKERFFAFDTLPVPDGRYRLEVTASDAPSNPFNLAQTSTWTTPAFVLDHTPPEISGLTAAREAGGLRIRFTATDAASVVKEAAVSADGQTWVEIAPQDRVFDQGSESFDVTLPPELVKGDRVLVRATDEGENEQTATAAVGAPGKK